MALFLIETVPRVCKDRTEMNLEKKGTISCGNSVLTIKTIIISYEITTPQTLKWSYNRYLFKPLAIECHFASFRQFAACHGKTWCSLRRTFTLRPCINQKAYPWFFKKEEQYPSHIFLQMWPSSDLRHWKLEINYKSNWVLGSTHGLGKP